MRTVKTVRTAIRARARLATLSPEDQACVAHAQAWLAKDSIRTDKVNEIKAELADGMYNTSDRKLDIAVERLLDDLAA